MLSRTLAAMGMALLFLWPQSVRGWQTAEFVPAIPAASEQESDGYFYEPPASDGIPPVYSTMDEEIVNAPPGNAYVTPYSESLNVFEASYIPPPRPWWVPTSFTSQLVWLNRSGSAQSVLLTGGIPDPVTLVPEHSTAVSMSDLSFPVEAGVRASLLFGRGNVWQPELAYLGIFDQNASVRYAPVASAGVTETATNFFDLVTTSSATDVTVSYESDLQCAEFNLWYDDGWRFQTLVGLRWMKQTEQFEQFETQNWANGTEADVANDLFGGQLGFRTFLFERGRLSLFAIAKGGVYHNNVSLDADVESGGVQLALLQQTGSVTSYSGEINLTAMWQCTPFCNIHAGYTGLWLSQVAVAGDQFNNFTFASGAGTFDYDGISYQGGHLGLTLAW